MSARNLETIHRKSGYTRRIWSASEYDTLLKDPRTVLVQDSCYFAIGRLVAGEAELLMIAVTQEHQGRGLGRRSLNIFEEVYETEGFDVISTRKAYYQLGKNNRVDALIMRKTFCLI
jgi:ribosomal-protein-alanine N-acetyltransferase